MSPATKRIIWILVSALIIAGLVLLLWLWYLGKEQASQSGGGNTNATSINTSNVPAGQNQPSVGNSPLGFITAFLGDIEKLISRSPSGYTTGSYQGGTTQGGGSQNGGQYSYPVYSGNQNTPNSTIPPSGTVAPNTPISTTTSPTNNSCISSCSCATNGTQTCTTGSQNTDGTCQITTTTCAQGSSCVECYGLGGGPATTTPIGGIWIPGGGSPFNPTPINGVSSSSPTGSGNIFNPTTGGNLYGGNGSTLTGTLLGFGVATAGCYALIRAEALQEAAIKTTIQGNINTLKLAQLKLDAGGVFAAIPALELPINEQLQQLGQTQAQLNNTKVDTLTQCLTRAFARMALDRITASTVNWIDSGFNGSPTFIQDYQQFFSDIANQAAGSYLQSSNFAFLCSPFALQVKIAVAESYAASQAAPTAINSCSLNQVTSNISNFLGGDFSAGGWPALISLTNAPSNNPFGAYIQLSSGLQSSISQAQQNAQNSISPGGFLSIHEVTNCKNGAPPTTLSSSVGAICPTGCDCPITTPGDVIEQSLNKALGTPVDQLNAAQDLNQIISALMQQLIGTALQGGVSNLNSAQISSSSGGDQEASLAQQLLIQMEGDTSTAQQYGYVEQGAISDIQATQGQLQTLANCWTSAATSTVFSTAQQTQAAANASSTEAQITSYQPQIDVYNNQITTANGTIALLQQLQSTVLNASSLTDVQGVQNTYTTDQSNGSLITSSDLITAQQDRTTLQSQLATVNQTTSTQLQQCYAFGT